MTFALIIVIALLYVWLSDTAKKGTEQQAYKDRTRTNVQLQDRLWCDNFKKIITDLDAVDKVTPIKNTNIIPAIESLFYRYMLPDERSETEKINDPKEYDRSYYLWQGEVGCSEEEKAKKLLAKSPGTWKDVVWYTSLNKNHNFDNVDYFFGVPNTAKQINGKTYTYNEYGRVKGVFDTVPATLIYRICTLLTTRNLSAQKFNYSYDRKESSWQEMEKTIKAYNEKKAQYPWLYNDSGQPFGAGNKKSSPNFYTDFKETQDSLIRFLPPIKKR